MSHAAPARRGFTLLELLVALTLSSVVLLGIVGVASQMIRWHIEGLTKSSDTAWTLTSVQRMSQELRSASALWCPYVDASRGGCPGDKSDILSGCENFSFLDSAIHAGPVKAFHYCVADNYGAPPARTLLRYYDDDTGGVCPLTGVVCGGGSPEVVARYVNKISPTTPYFTRRDDAGGVQIRYTVGQVTPTANRPVPVYTTVDVVMGMNKPYGNIRD